MENDVMVDNDELRNWFKIKYPHLTFNETWLKDCYDYLKNHFNLTNSELIQKVENQLLLSDLKISTTTTFNQNSNHHHHHLNQILSNIEKKLDFNRFPKQTQIEVNDHDCLLLLQIQSIEEIGQSNIHLENILDKKIQQLDGRDLVLDLDDDPQQQPQSTHESNNNNNDQSGVDSIKFPRSMLKFDLSDGHHLIQAIEYQPIPQLSLDHTPLGSKLIIHSSIKIRRGLLLLTNQNITFLGYHIDELESNRFHIFKSNFDLKLNRTINQSNEISNTNEIHQSRLSSSRITNTNHHQINFNNNQHDSSNNNNNNNNNHDSNVIEVSDNSDSIEFIDDDDPEFEALLLNI